MTSPSIYEMEAKYHAISQQLDSKAAELLKRAENAVKKQENCLYKFVTPSTSNENVNTETKYGPDEISETTLHYWKPGMDSYRNISTREAPSTTLTRTVSSEDKEPGLKNNDKKLEHTQALLKTRDRIRKQPCIDSLSQRSDSMPNLNEVYNNLNKTNLDCSEFEDNNDDDDDLKEMMREVDDHKQLDKTIKSLIEARDIIRKSNKAGGDKGFKRSRGRMPFSVTQLERDMARGSKVDRSSPRFVEDYSGERKDIESKPFKASRSVGEETIISTMRTNYKLLKDELMKTQDNLRKKSTECETVGKTCQQLEESKQRTILQLNSMRMQVSKLETKVGNLTTKLQGKETECRSLRSERDALAKAAKDAAQEGSGSELRLARARDEVLTLKEALATTRAQEKEYQNSTKQQMDEAQMELTRAHKRNRMAITALKKQALLADNLKRQVDLLSADKEVKQSSEQLDSMLRWNYSKKMSLKEGMPNANNSETDA